jgi:hypothetical protein
MVGQDKAALLEFLDFTTNKGLLRKTTVDSLKSACNAVFSILEEDEVADVFGLDLDGIFQRYENVRGLDLRPDTMQAYRQRVRQAISEFKGYKADPSRWKPQTRARPRSSNTAKNSEKTVRSVQNSVTGTELPDPTAVHSTLADRITHQFPLRRDTIVTISGIPFDVTKAEMGRMTAFLSNLVVGSEASDSIQLMLNAPDAESEQKPLTPQST